MTGNPKEPKESSDETGSAPKKDGDLNPDEGDLSAEDLEDLAGSRGFTAAINNTIHIKNKP